MSHGNSRRRSRQSALQQAHRQRLARQPGLPFAGFLSSAEIEQAMPAGSIWRERLYTPVITVWVFLSQVLDQDHSCRQAVARFLAWLVAWGKPACSEDTGAYCMARQRLPEATLSQLTRQTGRRLEEHSPRGWRWHKRRARFVDGSTVSMPDTPENQQAYPQPPEQRLGVGPPLPKHDRCFNVIGRRGGDGRRLGRTLSCTLECRTRSAVTQANAADGYPALQDARAGTEGDLDSHSGLQPHPHDYGSSGG